MSLDEFPNELKLMILYHINLSSLLQIRLVNFNFKILIDHLCHYKILIRLNRMFPFLSFSEVINMCHEKYTWSNIYKSNSIILSDDNSVGNHEMIADTFEDIPQLIDLIFNNEFYWRTIFLNKNIRYGCHYLEIKVQFPQHTYLTTSDQLSFGVTHNINKFDYPYLTTHYNDLEHTCFYMANGKIICNKNIIFQGCKWNHNDTIGILIKYDTISFYYNGENILDHICSTIFNHEPLYFFILLISNCQVSIITNKKLLTL